MNGKWAIGVDLGGTKVEVAQVSDEGVLGERLRFPTEVSGGPAAIEKAIAEAVNRLRQDAHSEPVGVGVGVAGQVEKESGLVRFAPNLDWHQVPFQANLEKLIGLPVRVINDVRAGTWGEWLFGAGRGCDHLVCLFIGTGIGGGIVSEGEMLYGASSTAGELGHMIVDLNGPRCKCGAHGCVEAFAGGASMARLAQEALKKNTQRGERLYELADHQLEAITTRLIVDAYRQGDELAKEIIEQATRALVAAVTNIVNGINPQRIILGGGVIDGLPELIDWIYEGVVELALAAATHPLRITAAQHGNDANVLGAAAKLFTS